MLPILLLMREKVLCLKHFTGRGDRVTLRTLCEGRRGYGRSEGRIDVPASLNET